MLPTSVSFSSILCRELKISKDLDDKVANQDIDNESIYHVD